MPFANKDAANDLYPVTRRIVCEADAAYYLKKNEQGVEISGTGSATIYMPPAEDCVGKVFGFYATESSAGLSCTVKTRTGGTILNDAFEVTGETQFLFSTGARWILIAETIA